MIKYQVIEGGKFPLDLIFDVAKAGEKYSIEVKIRYPDGLIRSEMISIEIVKPITRAPKPKNRVRIEKRK